MKRNASGIEWPGGGGGGGEDDSFAGTRVALETAVAQARALTFEIGSTTAFLKEEFQAGGRLPFAFCSFSFVR